MITILYSISSKNKFVRTLLSQSLLSQINSPLCNRGQRERERERERGGEEEEEEEGRTMVRVGLIVWDFWLSFMWAWAGSLTKLFVHGFLGWGNTSESEVLRYSISVIYMYVFAWLATLSQGGSYNPLALLPSAFLDGAPAFLFVALARIPSQIAGSIIGVRVLKQTFPQIGNGPRLNVDIHHGAIVEGLLTFSIVMVTLGLKKSNTKSFIMKTWMSTILKMSLHLLGADLTGGIMNPASALGWAYARGDHITKEHLLVYWLAPFQAALLAVWLFRLITEPKKTTDQLAYEQITKSE